MQIQCSNCGHIHNFKASKYAAERLVDFGWGSFGRALYCPDCSTSWAERNGDKQMADKKNTIQAIQSWGRK